jgi:group I intron endonuclease
MEKSSLIGVYELTSPSGKVYVGQSWNIEKRFNKYKNLNCQRQRKLFNSLSKYEFKNHKIKILELFYGEGATQETLDKIEIANINYNKEIGKELLNLASGGSRGKHSKESLEILRNRKGENHPSFGMKRSKEFCEKRKGEGNANFGNIGEKNPNFGKKQTEERRLKTSGENNYWYGKRGDQTPFFGKKQSLEHVAKRSGIHHKKAKQLIDTITGKIYNSIREASEDLNLVYSTLVYNIRSNKTSLRALKNYPINIANGVVV